MDRRACPNPSSSIASFASAQKKSTMRFAIGCCRRNFNPAVSRFFSRDQRRFSPSGGVSSQIARLPNLHASHLSLLPAREERTFVSQRSAPVSHALIRVALTADGFASCVSPSGREERVVTLSHSRDGREAPVRDKLRQPRFRSRERTPTHRATSLEITLYHWERQTRSASEGKRKSSVT